MGRAHIWVRRVADARRKRALERFLAGVARFELPGRTYLLFAGTVGDATRFCHPMASSESYEAPNLWWPEDRAWTVASEIDLPVTYVGGPRALVGEILAIPELGAEPIAATDRLG